jgi:RNA polymerase sigma factor for flagellar operon FliA
MTNGQDLLARDEAVESLYPLCRALAHNATRAGPTTNYQDAFQTAIVGAMDAVEKFKPNQGASLRTYAVHRIRGHLIDSLRGLDHLARSQRDAVSATDRANREIDPGAPTVDPGAPLGGFELDHLNNFAVTTEPGYTRVENQSEAEWLVVAIDTLTDERMRWIMHERLGGATLAQLGDTLGLTESRISQIVTRAGEILLASWGLPDDHTAVREDLVDAVPPEIMPADRQRRRHAPAPSVSCLPVQ